MNPKSLRDLPKDLEPFFQWLEKIEELKKQIDFLEKIKTHQTIRVSVFLLKSQLIEFELKQLISKIDTKISKELISSEYRRKNRTPKELSKDRCTFGKLISILDEYESKHLTELMKMLKLLVKPRNNFTHKLFDENLTFEEINKDIDKNITLANKTLVEIKTIYNKIKL